MLLWPGLRMVFSIVLVLAVLSVLVPKHFFRSLFVLFLLLLVCLLLLQTDTVQTWLVGRASARLSKSLHTRVAIKHVDFSFFNKMELQLSETQRARLLELYQSLQLDYTRVTIQMNSTRILV